MASGPGRTLGRYELISEVSKGQFGPLWIGHIPETSPPELSLVRRISTKPPVTADEKDALSEGAWWGLEVTHENIARAADVVLADDSIGIVYEYQEGELLRALQRLASFKRKAVGAAQSLCESVWI